MLTANSIISGVGVETVIFRSGSVYDLLIYRNGSLKSSQKNLCPSLVPILIENTVGNGRCVVGAVDYSKRELHWTYVIQIGESETHD